MPFTHGPRPEHMSGHVRASHASPPKPCWQKHAPSTHAPPCWHGAAHAGLEQSSPEEPAAHAQLPSSRHVPRPEQRPGHARIEHSLPIHPV